MEKNANYFLIGIFVLASLVAITGFSLWLASPRDTNEYDHYTVYFTSSVGGLEEGNDIRYKGVRVGKVEKIYIADDRPDLIKVDIAVETNTPVRAHTKVVLDMRGIAGFVSLELSTDPNDREMPKTPEGERFPVLTGMPSAFSTLIENMGKFSEDGFGEITAAATEIKGAATEIKHAAVSTRKLVDQLREDPSQVIRGPKKKRPQKVE